MTYKNATLHPAMTALAAVLALSSTTAMAQAIEEPTVTSTPAVESAPVPVAVEPIVPETTVEPTTAADPLAPKAASTPARKATAKTRAQPTAAVTKSARPATPAPALATTTPAPAAPAEEPLAAEAAAAPVAVTPTEQPEVAESAMDEMLPAAGIGGAALLLLAGAGLALRRRRRIADSEDLAWQDELAAVPAEPAPVAEAQYEPVLRQPAFVAAPAPVADPVPTVADLTPVEGPTTTLPAGFDLSRFSPNVQAAYRGPTEDNPSLSLKHRLRKASAMDQMERNAAETAPAEVPAAAADQPTGEFMLARVRKPAMRPLHTH